MGSVSGRVTESASEDVAPFEFHQLVLGYFSDENLVFKGLLKRRSSPEIIALNNTLPIHLTNHAI